MVLFLAASLVLPLEPACHDISYDRKHAEIRRNSSNTAASMTPTIILLGAWIGREVGSKREREREREREQRYDTEEFYYQIRVAFCYNIHEWISSSGSLLLKGSFGSAGQGTTGSQSRPGQSLHSSLRWHSSPARLPVPRTIWLLWCAPVYTYPCPNISYVLRSKIDFNKHISYVLRPDPF
jgi:hypothetical protein